MLDMLDRGYLFVCKVGKLSCPKSLVANTTPAGVDDNLSFTRLAMTMSVAFVQVQR